jgi:RNA polymerase-binding transcription factor DksA
MKDFTKEELEDIRNGITLLLQEDHCDSNYSRDIRSLEDKIQSLIDNYCEHEPHIEFGGFNQCEKCGKSV